MQILYSRCCGIDVHKNSETACVPIYSGSIKPEVRKRESGMAGAGGPLRLDSSQPISGQEPSRAQDRRAGQSMLAELLAHGLIRRSFVPPREDLQFAGSDALPREVSGRAQSDS